MAKTSTGGDVQILLIKKCRVFEEVKLCVI